LLLALVVRFDLTCIASFLLPSTATTAHCWNWNTTTGGGHDQSTIFSGTFFLSLTHNHDHTTTQQQQQQQQPFSSSCDEN
jgi:hypothetical protein